MVSRVRFWSLALVVGYIVWLLVFLSLHRKLLEREVHIYPLSLDLEMFTSKFVSHQFWTPHVKHDTDPNLTTKVVVFYNPPGWFNRKDMETIFNGCEVDACVMTDDMSLLDTADALWVYACFGPVDAPQRPHASQIWIAMTLESPEHCHLSETWASLFNWTMTYRADSDIFNPYGQLVFRPPKPPYKNYTAIFAGKNRTASWFVSNCGAPSQRDKYVQELRKYVQVDVYGSCGELSCPRSDDRRCLESLSSTYLFYLAFENSLCQDYVTEKFFKLFAGVDVIPVVRGGADYKKHFPPGTFVDASDFQNAENLGQFLMQLGSDQEAYTGFLRRKDYFVLDEEKRHTPACDMCKKLHYDTQGRQYEDIRHWWSNNTCRPPTDLMENHDNGTQDDEYAYEDDEKEDEYENGMHPHIKVGK